MITGEMEVGHIIAEWGKSTKKTTSALPTLPKLPTLAQPLISNPQDFIFEDPYESDPEKYSNILFEEKYGIYTSDTDEEAMNDVMDIGNDLAKK